MKIPRLLFVLCLSFNLLGQGEIRVFSKENKEPIPFARIDFSASNGYKFSAATDKWGVFSLASLNCPHDLSLHFRVRMYGFEPYPDSIRTGESKTCLLVPLINEIDPVVITGQINATTTENAVQRVRIIDRKTIDAKGAVNLRDVLQNELNIRLSQDQVLGSGMTMQGVSGENVKILIDGVPVIGRMDGNIDLSQLNLANIERIEIVEGPLSVTYGSNALAGTINLITKKSRKPGHEINLNSYYETAGQYNLDGRYAFTHKMHKLSVSGGRNYFDGWNASDPWLQFPKETLADSGRFQSWKPKEQYQLAMNYSVQLRKTTLSPYIDGFSEKVVNRGYPRAPYQISAFDDNYNTRRFNQGIHFQSLLTDRFKIQGVVAHNDYRRIKNTYLKDLTTLDQELSQNAADQDTSGFETWMSRATFSDAGKSARFAYEIGYDVQHETASGKRIADGKQQIGDYAVFSSADWKLSDKIVVRPGLRAAVNSVYGPSLIPSLHAKWNFSKFALRGSYARGFRAPSIKELYMDFVDINHNITGNSGLTPETSNHFQLWLNAKKNVSKLELTVDISGFYQHITDKISLAQYPNSVDYSYFNLDKFESTAAQLTFGINAKNIQAKAGFNYTGTRTNYSGSKFATSPEVNASVAWNWVKTGVSFYAYYKYTGKVVSYLMQEDQTLQQIFINDYHMLDANVARDFFRKKINVAIGAKNLLNVTNIQSSVSAGGVHAGGSSSPIGWGRSYYIRLQFKLQYSKSK